MLMHFCSASISFAGAMHSVQFLLELPLQFLQLEWQGEQLKYPIVSLKLPNVPSGHIFK
jgi:hypothetical protein